MSDSDDTDVLLFIPPDLFLVPSSESDDNSSNHSSFKQSKCGVVSELIDHVQSLESRITAIESKDSSNTSLSLSRRLSLDSIMSCRQTLPRTKFSVSQNSNLQNTPTKYPQCSSLPSTPSIRQQYTNQMPLYTKSYGNHQNNTSNSYLSNKHDNLKPFPELGSPKSISQTKSLLHAGVGSSEKESCSMLPALNVCESNVYNPSYNSLPVLSSNTTAGHFATDFKPIGDMSLSEVDAFLQEIENSNRDSTVKNSISNGQIHQLDSKKLTEKKVLLMDNEHSDFDRRNTVNQQKLKFNVNGYNVPHEQIYQSDYEKRRDLSDFTVANDSFISSFDTDKFMTDFKTWTPSFSHEMSDNKISYTEQNNCEEKEAVPNIQQKKKSLQKYEIDGENYMSSNSKFSLSNNKGNVKQYPENSMMSTFTDDLTKSQTISSQPTEINQNTCISTSKSCPSIFKTPSSGHISHSIKKTNKNSEICNNISSNGDLNEQNYIETVNTNESKNTRPPRLLTLSDFWNHDSSKSQEEVLQIKLEEERFRREHCEQLIQDLQKKLLEQQEKLAVAVRVDNEKNLHISQFQGAWKKMKQKISELESERDNLQKVLQNISNKHQSELADYQEQIKNYKEELSKALNLATGYKEKSDCLVNEKLELLKSHTDELQNYKSMVQQAETRYEEMKTECQKLFEKNQQKDENLKLVQQDLNKELLKNGEVRTEMTVIHKALDACESELTILRQEKESLQLKVKEETNRNNLLQQAKASLMTTIDEAKTAEKTAKNEVITLTEQREKLREELRDVYQKQVDEVVKTKLQEFQTQLDAAETVFQNEIETKQRAIAECAARKIKSVIDKHQLEISLIEEKQKEEKRLFEIKLAQAVQKSAMLEAQLNSYRKSRNQLVEQLHAMMQKQWQQALLIIAGGNGENISSLQKLNVDKLFSFPSETKLELIPNHTSTLQSETIKFDSLNAKNLHYLQNKDNQNESLVTLTSHDETPLTSKKESKNDLRKYIKMILDMQQSKEDYNKPKLFSSSPPSSEKENSDGKLHKDPSNEGNIAWPPISEMSIQDTSEYLSVPQKIDCRNDQQKHKPPWK